MAIALVGTPTTAVGASSTAATLSITVPTGSTGDLLIFNVATATVATASAPVITSATAGLTSLFKTSSAFVGTSLLFRFVQAADPTSYTFTVNAGAPYEAVCVRYSGVSTTTPFRFVNSSTTNIQTTSTAAAITLPAVDNVVSTDVTLCAVSMGTSVNNSTQATALSTPTSWTNVVNRLGPTGTAYHSATALYSRAAGVDTPSVTGSTGQYAAVSFVLIDASNTTTPGPGSAISFVNAATASPSANSATTVCNVPTGVVNGNVMLAVVTNPGGSSLSAPAGWTPLMETNAWVNQGIAGTYTDGVTRVWYRVASSEPANYTFTSTLSNHGAPVIIVAYSGTRTTSPVLLSNSVYSNGPGVTASTTSPAPYLLNQLTAIASDMRVVNLYAAGGDSSGLITMTNPGGTWTGRATAASTVAAAFNSAVGVADKMGATDVPTATSSVAAGWSVFSVALIGEPAHLKLTVAAQAVNRASTY